MTALRETAFDYLAAGLSVFPTAGKKPLCRWRAYQRRRPTERELGAMPWESATGLAVALGAVSGGLACRDFDRQDSYDRFAGENPWLAGQCPTSRTARGRHVFFRAAGLLKTMAFDDGELRGPGVYVCLPPSRHESGIAYTWLAEPANLIADAPEVDPAYFLPAKSPKPILEHSEPLKPLTPLKPHYIHCYVASDTEPWITCLPPEHGHRHKCIWALCRRVKADCHYNSLPLEHLEPYFKQWHALALPTIATKNYAESWRDFCNAWANCTQPGGMTLAQASAIAESLPPILDVAGPLERLARICRALSLNPAGEFFLDCRRAANLAGFTEHTGAFRALRTLRALGLIELIEPGTRGVTGRANRYRWIGEQPRGP